MPTYVWEHKETGEHREVTCAIKDCDRLPDSVDESDRGNWRRLIFPPAVLNRLIPEGFGIRQKDGNWKNAKEIAKLEDSRYDLPPGSEERKGINKAIKEIKGKTK